MAEWTRKEREAALVKMVEDFLGGEVDMDLARQKIAQRKAREKSQSQQGLSSLEPTQKEEP